MGIKDLKQNIEMEKRVVGGLFSLYSRLNKTEVEKEKRIINKYIDSYIARLRIINNSIPKILKTIFPFQKLERDEDRRGREGEDKGEDKIGEKSNGLINVKQASDIESGKISVTIEEKDRGKFLEELNISKDTLKRLKREGKEKEKKTAVSEFRKPSAYARISNRFFLQFATNMSQKFNIKVLNSYLRKANMYPQATTYLSMAILTSIFALIAGIIIFIVLLFLTATDFMSILRNSLLVVFVPVITFISFYYYPYLESRSIAHKIEEELPFVVIHMSAIAGSGIEPSQIFKIITLGEEYPNTGKEFKKIVNQVNIYGYDLITALKNTASETSSSKLNELLNGMATTVSSGGGLSEFLDKRAETLLFEYKMEKEKKTKSAETFMDIYISIVIAAPMILTLLLILITISGLSVGLSLSQLTIVILSIVALINIIFLVVLHVSQPAY